MEIPTRKDLTSCNLPPNSFITPNLISSYLVVFLSGVFDSSCAEEERHYGFSHSLISVAAATGRAFSCSNVIEACESPASSYTFEPATSIGLWNVAIHERGFPMERKPASLLLVVVLFFNLAACQTYREAAGGVISPNHPLANETVPLDVDLSFQSNFDQNGDQVSGYVHGHKPSTWTKFVQLTEAASNVSSVLRNVGATETRERVTLRGGANVNHGGTINHQGTVDANVTFPDGNPWYESRPPYRGGHR
ncbi:MAG: hypothetical protein J5J00_16415 [Deltaproteobacteria bacterium]|nr:hypothetical protein [Deltaproteobacteria bacterium]